MQPTSTGTLASNNKIFIGQKNFKKLKKYFLQITITKAYKAGISKHYPILEWIEELMQLVCALYRMHSCDAISGNMVTYENIIT